MDMEKFFMVTNPLFWLFYLVASVINAVQWIWENWLWNKKRFYWHMYDFYFAKKEIQKGLTHQGVRNARAWIARNEKYKIKHRYLKEIKSLVDEAENKILNEDKKRPTQEGE